MDSIYWKATLCIGGSIMCGLTYRLIRGTIYKQQETTLNEVLLYGANDENQTKEIGLDNLFCIYYVIAHATRAVDVCVPSLKSETIAKCLINLHQKNKAKIRVFIHKSNQFDIVKSYAEFGIKVKVITALLEPLEHEFILIDACDGFNDALALVGSLDYDTTRVNCNRDSTILISEQKVVINLKKEFERIWNIIPDAHE